MHVAHGEPSTVEREAQHDLVVDSPLERHGGRVRRCTVLTRDHGDGGRGLASGVLDDEEKHTRAVASVYETRWRDHPRLTAARVLVCRWRDFGGNQTYMDVSEAGFLPG